MGFIAAAIAVAAGATAYAASSASSSAKQASDQNAANVAATNALNKNQFLAGRGATGNAVLPLYLTQNGQPWSSNDPSNSEEALLGQNAIGLYDAAGGSTSPATQIAQYQTLANQFQPMQNQANTTAQSIFNGNLQSEELQNYAPVASALQQGVTSQKEASIEGLQQTLNQIKAIQAGQGFSGDSFGTNLMTSNAIQAANVAQAQNQANVNVQNSGAVQGIKTGILNTQLQNLNLPSTMAQENVNMSNAGANAAMTQEGQRQQLFNMFKISPQNFTYSQLPTVPPIASTGQVISQGVGALAGAAGNYFASQNGSGSASSAAAGAFPGINGAAPTYVTNLSLGSGSGSGIDPSLVGESQAVAGENNAALSLGDGSGAGW